MEQDRGRSERRRTSAGASLQRSRFKELKDRFDATHRDGMNSLRNGDYLALADAINREAAILKEQHQSIEEQHQLIEARHQSIKARASAIQMGQSNHPDNRRGTRK